GMCDDTLRALGVCVRRMRSAAAALGAMLVPALCLAAASAAQAQEPPFRSGGGINVVGQSQTGREIDLTVNTTDVQGQHKIIVLLPEGYDANPNTRFPVLYLLNGALADPTQWVTSGGAAAQITDPYS